MNIYQLGNELKNMYNNAPKGEKALMINLFGIRYADVIVSEGYSISEIIKIAGLKESYAVEVNKGIKLSKYVVEK